MLEINVKVQIGVTEEVNALLTALLGGRAPERTIFTEEEVKAMEPKKPTLGERLQHLKQEPKKPTFDEHMQQLEENTKKLTGSKKDESQVTNQEKDEKPAEVKKEAENEPKQEQAPVTYSAEDTREAMHRCRTRFEGEGYKDNTESESYLKYHKKLTAWFKYLASTSGAADSKPSSLTAEQRKAFIDDCDDTILGDDGNFTLSKAPF